jgi:hypothetical protein
MKIGILCALVLLASSGCSPTRPRNLILVRVDTLRADYLSCYGSKRASTPGFDRIARNGVLFENATTVAPMTLPAHASLLTGVSPLVHSVHDNVGFRLRDDIPTLATLLKAKGYRTGGFVGSFVLDERFGLARGFDVYSDHMPQTERLGLPERPGGAVLEEATQWIDGSPDEPFLLSFIFSTPIDPTIPLRSSSPAFRIRSHATSARFSTWIRCWASSWAFSKQSGFSTRRSSS